MTSTGTVIELKIWQDGTIDLAFVTLKDSVSGQSEQFTLWASDTGTPTPFSVWIERSMVVSMLRDALVNKLQVSVTHGTSSGILQYVQLLAA
jgi:hypothetical protein